MPPIFRHNNSILINDYVDSCDKVPTMTAKNRDKTLIISQFEIVLSDNYPKPAKNDVIRAYSNSSTNFPFFSGYVCGVKQDYTNDQYVVTVMSDFQKLKEEVLNYNNLNAQLRQTTNLNEYNIYDNQGFPNVQVLYLIKQMCFLAGINLTITNEIKYSFVRHITYEGEEYDMLVHHLVMDENMLYALNQSSACNHITIEATNEGVNKRLNLFDFVSEFCSHFNAHIYLNSFGNPNWYTIDLAGAQNPFYQSDLIYQKYEERIIGDVGGYSNDLLFCEDRIFYSKETLSELQSHSYQSTHDENLVDIGTINNWVYLFRNPLHYGGVLGGTSYINYPYCYEARYFLMNKTKVVMGDFVETTLIINNYLPTSANLTQLDMEREETELLWSEYVGGVSE